MSKNKFTKGVANCADKLVAKRIRTIRLLRGISQQQIAQALSVSIQQIQKYEKGTNRISSGKLYDLAKFLGVPITCFFEQHDGLPLDLDINNNVNLFEKDILVLINSFSLIKNAKLRKHLLNTIVLIAQY